MKILIRWLSSIKLGISLIAAVAIACIWGSLIAADPKQGVDHAVVNVFSAPWFLVLVALLALNLVLCSWEKTWQALTLPKRTHFAASKQFFEQLGVAAVVERPERPEQLQQLLRRHFFFLSRQGNSFYAQKGVPGRWGATTIHIGLLLVMGATIVRGLASALGLGIYDANIIANEGDVARHYFTRKDRLAPATGPNLRPHALPFYFKVLDFSVENYPGSSVVKDFRCLIEAGEAEQPRIALLTMSSPFYFRGVKITLNSYSENPARQRPTYLVVDQVTSQSQEVDVADGDAVLLSLVPRYDFFLEIVTSGSQKIFRILDLGQHRVIQEGDVSGGPALRNAPMERMIAEAKELPESIFLVRAAALRAAGSNAAAKGEARDGQIIALHYKEGQFVEQVWIAESETTISLGNRWLLCLRSQEDERTTESSAASSRLWIAKQGDSNTSGQLVLTSDITLVEIRENEAKLELISKFPESPASLSSSRFDAQTSPASSRFQVIESTPRASYTVFLGLMYDPALPWFYLGCGVIFLGMALAFSMVHRELWFWYDPESGYLYCGMRFYRRESARGLREFWKIVHSAASQGMHCDPTVEFTPERATRKVTE